MSSYLNWSCSSPSVARTNSPRTISPLPGLTFAYTSWLGPNSSDGFADQQTGGFIAGPRSLYPAFEATRALWHQMPAAVQVSAAQNISFSRDRFQDLGSVALGIGNDDNA